MLDIPTIQAILSRAPLRVSGLTNWSGKDWTGLTSQRDLPLCPPIKRLHLHDRRHLPHWLPFPLQPGCNGRDDVVHVGIRNVRRQRHAVVSVSPESLAAVPPLPGRGPATTRDRRSALTSQPGASRYCPWLAHDPTPPRHPRFVRHLHTHALRYGYGHMAHPVQ